MDEMWTLLDEHPFEWQRTRMGEFFVCWMKNDNRWASFYKWWTKLLHEYFTFILVNIFNVCFMIYVGGGNWMSSMNIHTSISLHKCLMLYPWIWFIIRMMLKEFLLLWQTNPFIQKVFLRLMMGVKHLDIGLLDTCQYLFVHTCWNVLNLVLTNVINKLLTHCQRHHV